MNVLETQEPQVPKVGARGHVHFLEGQLTAARATPPPSAPLLTAAIRSNGGYEAAKYRQSNTFPLSARNTHARSFNPYKNLPTRLTIHSSPKAPSSADFPRQTLRPMRDLNKTVDNNNLLSKRFQKPARQP